MEAFVVNPVFAGAAPRISLKDAATIARNHFGINAASSTLSSERDCNFRLDGDDGETYVLKVSNAGEAHEIINLQTAALRRLERHHPDLPVPRLCRTLSGDDEAIIQIEGEQHIVRLMTFLPGIPAGEAEVSFRGRRALGRVLAQLDRALTDFCHPAARYDLLWDISTTHRVEPIVRVLVEPTHRRLAEAVLDRFNERVAAVLPNLRRQVIHNDFNPNNVLVADKAASRVSGIIDFGDLIEAPLINDLAIAAAYQMILSGDPLEAMNEVASAYHDIHPLEREELEVLLDLATLRMAFIGTISQWRAERHTENRGYLLRNTARTWACLENLAERSRSDASAALLRACA